MDGGIETAFGIGGVLIIEQASLRHQHIVSLAFWSALARSGSVDRASDSAEQSVVASFTILFCPGRISMWSWWCLLAN